MRYFVFHFFAFTFFQFCIYAQAILDVKNSQSWASSFDSSIFQIASIEAVEFLDFTKIWTDENYFLIGIIGDHYQRLDIKYISIIKGSDQEHIYYVYGKSKVKNSICTFQGTIELVQHFKQTKDVHNGYLTEGMIIANCRFFESKGDPHSGFFKGVMRSYYAVDTNGVLIYPDDGDLHESNYNNGFVGVWESYTSSVIKKVHWGNNFVPMSGDLNVAQALGDFIPNEKYQIYGWMPHQDGWLTPIPVDWWK